jgi:hypothetical protein
MPLFGGVQSKDSERLGGDSERSGGDSERLGGDSERLAGPDSDEWKELEKIAEPVASVRKVAPEVVQDTVLKLCQGRYLLSGQISRLLKRHPVRVRQQYLKPLVV